MLLQEFAASHVIFRSGLISSYLQTANRAVDFQHCERDLVRVGNAVLPQPASSSSMLTRSFAICELMTWPIVNDQGWVT